MYSLEDYNVWELPTFTELEKRSNLQKLTNFKSKSGHKLVVKQLNDPEHPQFINDNWKSKDELSVHWIRSQCKRGFAYGVFATSEEATGMVIQGREKGLDTLD